MTIKLAVVYPPLNTDLWSIMAIKNDQILISYI